jgi:hypothetical protein
MNFFLGTFHSEVKGLQCSVLCSEEIKISNQIMLNKRESPYGIKSTKYVHAKSLWTLFNKSFSN